MAMTEGTVSFHAVSTTRTAAWFGERLGMRSEFDGREDVLDGLREDHDLRVQCHGSSASSQGGFWPAPEVLQRLGRLGVDFTCTVYLADCPDVC